MVPRPLFSCDLLADLVDSSLHCLAILIISKVHDFFRDFSGSVDDDRTLSLLVDGVEFQGIGSLVVGDKGECYVVGLELGIELLQLIGSAVQKVHEGSESGLLMLFGFGREQTNDVFDVVVFGSIEKHLTRRCKGVLSDGADSRTGVRAGDVFRVVGWSVIANIQS